VKLLLTSAGIKNASIADALVDLLGKQISEANALCIPTALHAIGGGRAPSMVYRNIAGVSGTPMNELGWKSVGVLELAALPSLPRERWVSAVRETDALLVAGGDPLYLTWWIRQSGLADLLPSLAPELVWMGVSAGSTVMGPTVGEEFVNWTPPSGGHETLGVVGFAMFPHVDHPMLPDNHMGNAEKWAARLPVPGYAMDDDTAIKVVDGSVEVVSEGHWRLFSR
jgi:dipeptidase E